MIDDISNILKSSRIKKNLSIKQVSDDTKIRTHFIEAIENGNFTLMPDIYNKSFIKTLLNYYKIDESTIQASINTTETPTLKSSKTEKKFSDELSKKAAEPKEVLEKIAKTPEKKAPKNEEVAKYAELFKKKNVKKVSRVSLFNYIIYFGIAAIVIIAVIITLYSLKDEDISETVESKSKSLNDTVTIKPKENNLLSYFEKTDSLVLKAKAKDTAWIRIVIDGKDYSESLMKPGDSREWSAYEYFIVDAGNAGAITFYRFDEQLPLFGKPGTVVKGVKVTRDNVINQPIITPKNDTTGKVVPKKSKPKQKPQSENKPIQIIQESNIIEQPDLLKKNPR